MDFVKQLSVPPLFRTTLKFFGDVKNLFNGTRSAGRLKDQRGNADRNG
jgi:hypothetical protein